MNVEGVRATPKVKPNQTVQSKTNNKVAKKTDNKPTVQQTENVVYEKTKTPAKKASYNKEVQREVYLNRALEMKAEAEQRLVELFGSFSKDGVNEQAGGIKNALKAIFSEKSDDQTKINQNDIEAAKASIAEGGYYSAESTSDRFIEFAKNISNDNPKLADKLIDAFKEGYKQAEEMWGGELPEISKQTYDLTLEKFDAWKNGTDNPETVD